MSEGADSGLGLDAVVRRFGDAEKALDEVRGRLASLGESAERSQTAAGALTDAAESVKSFAGIAGSVAAELQAAVAEAKAVFEKSGDLLGGNALDSVQKSIADLTELVTNKLGEIETRMQRIEDVFQALPARWRGRVKS